MNILGINAYHPDSAAALVKDGKVVAACEEERFRRIKHFSGFPAESIRCCLKDAGISIKDVDYIALPRRPGARILTKALYGLKIRGLAQARLSAWQKTFQVKDRLAAVFGIPASQIVAKIVNIEHHRAHLASAFFASNFDKAFLFSADALGDFASTVWGQGQGNKIQILGEVVFPHSLGFYYTAITQYLGFLNFGDEYKVMGLAAYGGPEYIDEFRKILKIKGRRFVLGLEYFRHHRQFVEMAFADTYPKLGLLSSPYLEKRLGRRRLPDEPLEQRHKDIACSLQKRLEEVIIHLINSNGKSGLTELCLSGGVAFNCLANAKLPEHTQFKNIYIPPAAGDAGLAVGAALYLWNHILEKPRDFFMQHAYWGPAFSEGDVEFALKEFKINFRRYNELELIKIMAEELAAGKILGWFQGRMEWGPRALGNRSILADPRRPEMKDILNARVKHREPFRPFAPSILEEYVHEYFSENYSSPFMNLSPLVKKEKRKDILAALHIDGTARFQTVSRKTNPKFWQLIEEFRKISGVPALLNTSFNDNEPIVLAPLEALECFLAAGMDALALGDYLITKNGLER